MREKKNMEGRHVGLDFYDLLIEASVEEVEEYFTRQSLKKIRGG
jgi:hypothetical protein